jgi:peroxiredoxin
MATPLPLTRCIAAALLILVGCTQNTGQPDPITETRTAPEPASLQARLDARQAEWQRSAPAGLAQTFADGIQAVRETGLTETALGVGDTIPVFILRDHHGRRVNSSSILRRGPLVLTWYRGAWCPYCNIHLRAYQEMLPEIKARGAELVAISPQTPDHSSSTAEKLDLEFIVLSDPGNRIARRFGIVYALPPAVRAVYEQKIGLAQYNGDDAYELPLAATYVVDSDGVIRYAFLDADYHKRAEPAAVLAALREVARIE